MARHGAYRALSREHAEVSAGRRPLRSASCSAKATWPARARCSTTPTWPRWRSEEIASDRGRSCPQLEDELQRLLLPKDPDDVRNTFLEIRAGTGGDESALFAGDLLRMYTRYAERAGLALRDRERKRERSSAATRKW